MTNPYNFLSDNPELFEFQTDFGVSYRVYFTNASGYFLAYPSFAKLVKAFGFEFGENPPKALPRDPRVSDTIAAIVRHYLDRNPEVALFFFIDNSDGKQNGRKRTFDQWFQKFGHDWLVKSDTTIPVGRSQIHCSIVCRTTHLFLEQILEGFRSLSLEAGNKPETS